MGFPLDTFSIIISSMAVAGIVLIVISRFLRHRERRAGLTLIGVIIISCAFLLYLGREQRFELELLLPIFLIELGAIAYLYDTCRTYRSVTRNLKNIGSVYIYTGIVCLLSWLSEFPIILWYIPLLLISFGYFFLPKRRGLANFCKGAALLFTVAFTASIVYDAREGALPSKKTISIRERLLPEIMKPSIVEELNKLNEKLLAVQQEKDQLNELLLQKKAECRELKGKLEGEATVRSETEQKIAELERKNATLEETITRLEEEAQVKLEKAKERFKEIEEELQRAAENLKKVVKERDELKEEVTRLSAAVTPPVSLPLPTPPAGSEELNRTVAENKKLNAAHRNTIEQLTAVIQQIKKTLDEEPVVPTGAPEIEETE